MRARPTATTRREGLPDHATHRAANNTNRRLQQRIRIEGLMRTILAHRALIPI
jgi:hypothetical protein